MNKKEEYDQCIPIFNNQRQIVYAALSSLKR